MNLLSLTHLLLAPLGAFWAENTNSKVLDRPGVAMGLTSKLKYKATPEDHRIMDFFHVGYWAAALCCLPCRRTGTSFLPLAEPHLNPTCVQTRKSNFLL
jgi:hypothetical protein